MKLNIISKILLGAIFCTVGSPCWAAQITTGVKATPGASINVTADKMSAGDGGNQIEATGNVEIKRDEMTLKADEARMNQRTQDVEAKGKVSLSSPEWKIKSADSMQMNLEKETGELQNADLFLESGHLSISGRRLQKLGGQSYHIDDGFFTTCLCESGTPEWKFSSDQMDLNLDGAAIIKGGYLYILDVPVFYLPWGYFPLNSERQTGFLFPSVGHSTTEGFRYLQPFFWAISKSTDATATFDVESRARVGAIGEFRTLFSEDANFRITGAYFNESWRKNAQDDVVDRTIADQRIPQNRWSIISAHRYATPYDWLTFSDIAAYRDDLFTRELIDRFDLPGSQEVNIRRSRYGESRFGVFKAWGDTFVKGEWNFYQDFIQPDSTTLQRTPQLTFWGRRFLTGFPLEFRWRADSVNYLRREGGDGLRFDFRPEVVLPFRLAPHVFGSLSAAPRETAYHLYSPVKSSDHNVSRELIELRGNIGTAVSRVFRFESLGLGRIKHVLEPELNYLFVPGVNQSKIPIMDGVDRINRRNVVQFAVNNRLWGKPLAPLSVPAADANIESLNPSKSLDARQMASLRMALSYDIDRERNGGDSLTDLDLNLKLTPYPYIDISFDGGINPGPWDVTQARATLALTDPRPILRRSLDFDFNRPNAITLSYYFLRRGPNSFLADDANIDLDAPANCVLQPLDPRCPGTGFDKNSGGNISGNLIYRATDNVLFNFSSTYGTRDNKFLGFRATTKLLSFCECWTVTLAVTQSVNPSKTSVGFDFNLLGLGSSRTSIR
jgi:LPS-assembly protein